MATAADCTFSDQYIQASSPFRDPANYSTERPAIFSSSEYPSTSYTEPTTANQRWVGGAGASDANDGQLVANGGTGPWATLDKALQEYGASSTWYCLNIGGDITVSASFWTKTYGAGPGSISQFGIVRGDPDLVSPPTITINGLIRLDGQQYILWHDFNMAGTHGFELGEDLSTQYNTFRNITGTMTGLGGDNHGFMYARGTTRCNYFGVFNCDLTGPGIGGGIHGNTACVILSFVDICRIENNVVTNAPRPIYFKHTNVGAPTIHIRRNWSKVTAGGEVDYFALDGVGGTANIHDNIFEGTVEISNGGGGNQIEAIDWDHNTVRGDLWVVGDTGGGNNDPINCTFKNSIIETDMEMLRYDASANTNTTNYNLYGGSIWNNSTSRTLAQWQTFSSQDANSIAGAPTYTGGASPTTVAGYALTAASNGYQAADDGSDMGARTQYVGNM